MNKLINSILSRFARKSEQERNENSLRIAASLHPTKGWRKGESSSPKLIEIVLNNGTRINLRKQKRA